ncbi:hypothetical protein BAE44_0003932 [Dichanthelium oligosanthes]|uniref:Carbohydrate kinase PfkB domain-containing protein n=1 Tax=Dichanthelium oligosanthes TaxID=888268 RepID=A0A1E5WCU1_9POAL|nr:hypothetical protein BAE44_0003932 [Dichanthelium oligosanthes]
MASASDRSSPIVDSWYALLPFRLDSSPPSLLPATISVCPCSLESLPAVACQLGCGATSVDYLATVASFPNPDDKIRSLARCREAATRATPSLQLHASDSAPGPFPRKTRTCIHTPGYPPMSPEELTKEILSAALDGADIVYFDVRLHDTALVVAQEANLRISADGVGSISGRLLLCTAEVIPPDELIDTTGAGDAFIVAVLYGLCTSMPPERMLPFAAQVAGCGCRGSGARSSLPHRTDLLLADY